MWNFFIRLHAFVFSLSMIFMWSKNTGTWLYISYARRSGASHKLRRSESKKAKLEELRNNISDRSEAYGTGILSDLLLGERSEVSGKSAIYYVIHIFSSFFYYLPNFPQFHVRWINSFEFFVFC